MDATRIHLMIVHVPAVGCLFVLALLLIAHRLKDETVFKIGYAFLLFCAVGAAVAYISGGYAYEELGGSDGFPTELVESHALIARVAFTGIVVVGVAALSVFVQYYQGEVPHRWHRRAILISVLALCYLFAWASHIGGQVRHTEIRGVSWIFPSMGTADE